MKSMFLSAATFALVLGATSAHGMGGGQACLADAEKLCPGDHGGRLTACLEDNSSRLSGKCRSALSGGGADASGSARIVKGSGGPGGGGGSGGGTGGQQGGNTGGGQQGGNQGGGQQGGGQNGGQQSGP